MVGDSAFFVGIKASAPPNWLSFGLLLIKYISGSATYHKVYCQLMRQNQRDWTTAAPTKN